MDARGVDHRVAGPRSTRGSMRGSASDDVQGERGGRREADEDRKKERAEGTGDTPLLLLIAPIN